MKQRDEEEPACKECGWLGMLEWAPREEAGADFTIMAVSPNG